MYYSVWLKFYYSEQRSLSYGSMSVFDRNCPACRISQLKYRCLFYLCKGKGKIKYKQTGLILIINETRSTVLISSRPKYIVLEWLSWLDLALWR